MTSRARSIALAVVATLAFGALASPGRAQRAQAAPAGGTHPQLDAGQRALDDAEFRAAIRAFDRAQRSEGLSRDELVGLLEGRAMARFALGDEASARPDLVALASLDPTHRFPAEAPPELGDALGALVRESGGALALELTWHREPTGSRVTVEVRRDVASLVRTVRIHVRAGPTGAWHADESRSVLVEHDDGVPVHAWVEALGATGTPLVMEGSSAEPVVHAERVVRARLPVETPAPAPLAVVPVAAEEPDDPADDTPLIVGLVVGGAALVLGAVVLGVAVGTQGSSDRTQPSAPVVLSF